MATPKVCGIETEYGILLSGAEVDPITASSLIVSAYKDSSWAFASFDASHENPSRDARGVNLDDYLDPVIDSKMINTVLSNGARYYVDHAHPEYSSPECATIRDAVLFDVAGEFILRESMNKANERLPQGVRIDLYKNNSDGKGNSYGCHENYLVDRQLPFAKLAAFITTHFVTRQIFCGAGKVGHETPTGVVDQSGFQISQRADFFEELVGLETTMKRPIVNTRDEPHCDPQKYRRLHVIVGDANMSEGATLLKLGTTSIVLSMIEDSFIGSDLALAHPVPAIRQVSHDPTLRRTLLMQSGARMSALDIQWQLLERATRYAAERGLESVGEEVGRLVLGLWEEVLQGLSGDRSSVADIVDWVAKERLLDAYSRRHDIAPGDARLRAIDLQYHDMRPGRGLAAKVGLRTFVSSDEVEHGVDHAPHTTRAYFRGECLRRWPDDIVAANWDSMVFDVGRDPLRRVPMMEPLRGTKAHVGALLEASTSISDLVERLGA